MYENSFNSFKIMVHSLQTMWSIQSLDNFCSFQLLKTLRPRQNGRHFTDAVFKCIFLNENVWMLIKISLKFVPKGPINNTIALVQIMAWHRPGDEPLSEPMMIILLTHIYVSLSLNKLNIFQMGYSVLIDMLWQNIEEKYFHPIKYLMVQYIRYCIQPCND